jgi:DNA-binding response OmpR family regulator
MSQTAGLNVLVIEDRQEEANTLKRLLNSDGHVVRVALDGQAGLSELLHEVPDVMLLDLGLPKLDGLQVAAAARVVDWPRRPLIVAVTGHGERWVRQQAAEVGIDFYLVKPVNFDRLRSFLRTFHPDVASAPSTAHRWIKPQSLSHGSGGFLEN